VNGPKSSHRSSTNAQLLQPPSEILAVLSERIHLCHDDEGFREFGEVFVTSARGAGNVLEPGVHIWHGDGGHPADNIRGKTDALSELFVCWTLAGEVGNRVEEDLVFRERGIASNAEKVDGC